MSRKQKHTVKPSPAPSPVFPVPLTEEEIKTLVQMLRVMPIQGSMQTLPHTLEKMILLQEKLAGALKA